jgi:hypothetical protein
LRKSMSDTPVTDAAEELTEWADGMAEWLPTALEIRAAMLRAFVDLGEALS